MKTTLLLQFGIGSLVAAALALGCGGNGGPGSGDTGGTTPPDASPYEPDAGEVTPNDPAKPFFFDTSNNALEPSIAVDGSGAIHVAYRTTTSPLRLKYARCTSGCASPANFTVADLADAADGAHPSLALDPQGRPRIAWFVRDAGGNGMYRFGSCDANCTSAAAWTSAMVYQTGSLAPWAGRYFAVDAQGRPALAVADSGTVYVSCTQGCTASANWSQVRLSTTPDYQHALSFADAGQPRIGYRRTDAANESVGYLECNAGCDNAASWSGNLLFGVGSGGDFDLRVDAQGRPRIALYEGYLPGTPQNLKTYWAWCNAGCNDDTKWSSAELAVPERFAEGGISLALDAQGNPSVAGGTEDSSNSQYGAALARCTAGCLDSNATWKAAFVESDEDATTANPVPLDKGCSISAWAVGKEVSLALDAAGSPRLAYDAIHSQGGTCAVHEDVEMVRVAVLP